MIWSFARIGKKTTFLLFKLSLQKLMNKTNRERPIPATRKILIRRSWFWCLKNFYFSTILVWNIKKHSLFCDSIWLSVNVIYIYIYMPKVFVTSLFIFQSNFGKKLMTFFGIFRFIVQTINGRPLMEIFESSTLISKSSEVRYSWRSKESRYKKSK